MADDQKKAHLKRMTHFAEHPNQVEEECCAAWAKAHLRGTDCDAIWSLVGYDVRGSGKPLIGTDLLPVQYCPWCGAIKTKRRTRQR